MDTLQASNSTVHSYSSHCFFPPGSCTATISSSGLMPVTFYQFRVELNPAASCWCVMITVNVGSDSIRVFGSDFNCGRDQPNGSMLCAEQYRMSSFLSMVVIKREVEPGIFDFEKKECSAVEYSTYNSKDIGIAYQNTFQPLACQNTCSTFPLIPVNKTTESLM